MQENVQRTLRLRPENESLEKKRIGCGRPTISHHSEVVDKIRLSNFTKQAISEKAADLYQSGASLRSIAKELGCSKTAVRESLIREKVDLRAHSHSQVNKTRKSATLSVRNAPYGYCLVNGMLTEDPREMSVVALMLKWWGQGMSYGAIARKLNSQKVKPRKAATWSQPTVGFIIQRQSEHNRRSNDPK